MRVLLVDHDSALLETLTRSVGPPFTIDAVTNKGDTIDLLRSNVYDIIVACEKLEDGSGLELLTQAAKRRPEMARIFAAEPERLRLLRGRLGPFGLLGTLTYPIDPEHLVTALDAAEAEQQEPSAEPDTESEPKEPPRQTARASSPSSANRRSSRGSDSSSTRSSASSRDANTSGDTRSGSRGRASGRSATLSPETGGGSQQRSRSQQRDRNRGSLQDGGAQTSSSYSPGSRGHRPQRQRPEASMPIAELGRRPPRRAPVQPENWRPRVGSAANVSEVARFAAETRDKLSFIPESKRTGVLVSISVVALAVVCGLIFKLAHKSDSTPTAGAAATASNTPGNIPFNTRAEPAPAAQATDGSASSATGSQTQTAEHDTHFEATRSSAGRASGSATADENSTAAQATPVTPAKTAKSSLLTPIVTSQILPPPGPSVFSGTTSGDQASSGTMSTDAPSDATASPPAPVDTNVHEPRLIKQGPTTYPPDALTRGVEGSVEVSFAVTTDGGVVDVLIVGADPPDVFDQAAATAVRQWKFRPKTIDGLAVETRLKARLQFHLQRKRR